MKRINARVLLNYTTDQLWNSLIGEFQLVFDDGEIITTSYKRTIYSSYFWDFHRRYPKLKLLKTHHVDSIAGKYFNSNTHIKLLKTIYWDCVDAYGLHTPQERDTMTKQVYEVTNHLYNDLSTRLSEHVLTLDILDFINLVEYPPIKEILSKVEETPESIEETYSGLLKVINKDDRIELNPIVRTVRYGTVKRNQILQCIGPRGYCTEIDSEVLNKPILRSFTQGMRTLYNLAVESRSAAKSYFFSEAPLQNSEYFARRLQLITINVERIHYCDCGSKKYLHWRVNGPVLDESGKVIKNSDLPNLVGKYYLMEDDPDDAPLKVIKASDTHLHGKLIKIRDSIYCQHPDPKGICEICFGEMAYNVPQRGNLGHNCAASVTKNISQSVLSTKHLDASAKSENIPLSPENRRFFITSKNKIFYILRKDLSKYKPVIKIDRSSHDGILDINKIDDIRSINITRISIIKHMTITLTERDGSVTSYPLSFEYNKKSPSLTLDFLEYIKIKYGKDLVIEVDPDKNKKNNVKYKGSFVFDMSGWDYSKPILKYPEMEYNYSDYQTQIAAFIEGSGKKSKERESKDPTQFLYELFDLVNSKQSINIAPLGVIVYSIMTRDCSNGQYAMARYSDQSKISTKRDIIHNRSLSAAYAFEHQIQVMTKPSSFYLSDRPGHLLDIFVKPAEVLQDQLNHPEMF